MIDVLTVDRPYEEDLHRFYAIEKSTLEAVLRCLVKGDPEDEADKESEARAHVYLAYEALKSTEITDPADILYRRANGAGLAIARNLRAHFKDDFELSEDQYVKLENTMTELGIIKKSGILDNYAHECEAVGDLVDGEVAYYLLNSDAVQKLLKDDEIYQEERRLCVGGQAEIDTSTKTLNDAPTTDTLLDVPLNVPFHVPEKKVENV